MVRTIVIKLALMELPGQALASFPQIQTTFRLNDVLPMTLADAANWAELKYPQRKFYFRALPQDQRFAAAHRMFRRHFEDRGTDIHSDGTDFTLIFDADGNVAGMQSAVPVSSFGWKCTDNEFYQAATFQHITYYQWYRNYVNVQYCLATMYFRHPSTINTKGYKADPSKDILYLQKGASYDDANLVAFPKKYKDAVEDAKKSDAFWKIDKYFPGMGHHITRRESDNNCQDFMPIQGLYAHVGGIGGECINTGFVWAHANSTVKDEGIFSPDGKESWETPPRAAIGLILDNPAECQLKLAEESVAKTQHVFLGGSTTFCYSY